MQNVLDLNNYGVAEMQNAEMEQTEGGLGILGTIVAGVVVAAVTVVLTDWKEFERGFASTQK